MERKYITLGQKVGELRYAKRVSQETMENWLVISKGYLNQIESGDKMPGIGVVERIAEYFEITTEKLLEDVCVEKFGLLWTLAASQSPIPEYKPKNIRYYMEDKGYGE